MRAGGRQSRRTTFFKVVLFQLKGNQILFVGKFLEYIIFFIMTKKFGTVSLNAFNIN